MTVNIYLFYYYVAFVHHDAKIADIYLRITGKGRDYFLPEDNEISWRLLKHQYIEGELNANRILANKLDVWNNINKEEDVTKLIHFYKFTSAKSLEQGDAFYGNIWG